MEIREYTGAQLLHEWRLRRFPEWRASDCTVAVTDGIDSGERDRAMMLAWYHALVARADPTLTPPVDITALCRRRGSALTLPECAVRVTAVCCEGWARPALLVTDPDCREALLQCSPYTCGTEVRPVALVTPPVLRVWPAPEAMPQVMAVADFSASDRFLLNPAALDTVEPLESLN